MQPGRGFKTFGTRTTGRVVLVLAAAGVLTLSFLYLGAFIAIVAFLLFGLAIPIYAGWKVPRQLAVAGLVALVISAPLISVGETVFIRTPAPIANSAVSTPFSGPVMQNAQVNPYTGDQGYNFTWSVDLTPSYLPANSSGIVYLLLIVSNCPSGIGPSSPYCPAGYPFFNLTQGFGPNGTTVNQTVTFHLALPGANIWYWQMDAQFYANPSDQNFTHLFLNAGTGVAMIEGPVSGDFFATFGIIFLSIVQAVFLYIATVFYVALLIYWIFKTRQRRREAAATLPQGAAAAATAPPAAGAALPTEGPKPSAPPGPDEISCPNCQAVVYPNETRCWKCGADLRRPDAASTPAT